MSLECVEVEVLVGRPWRHELQPVEPRRDLELPCSRVHVPLSELENHGNQAERVRQQPTLQSSRVIRQNCALAIRSLMTSAGAASPESRGQVAGARGDCGSRQLAHVDSSFCRLGWEEKEQGRAVAVVGGF